MPPLTDGVGDGAVGTDFKPSIDGIFTKAARLLGLRDGADKGEIVSTRWNAVEGDDRD